MKKMLMPQQNQESEQDQNQESEIDDSILVMLSSHDTQLSKQIQKDLHQEAMRYFEKEISFHSFETRYLEGIEGVWHFLQSYHGRKNPLVSFENPKLKSSFDCFLKELDHFSGWVQRNGNLNIKHPHLLSFRQSNKMTGHEEHDPEKEIELQGLAAQMISSYHAYLQATIDVQQPDVKKKADSENKTKVKIKWKDFEIKFIDDNNIHVSIKGNIKKGDFDLLGLKINSKPWLLLKQLSIQGAKTSTKKPIYIKRGVLISNLGISGNDKGNILTKHKKALEESIIKHLNSRDYEVVNRRAIIYDKNNDSYITQFKLIPERDLRNAEIFITNAPEYDDETGGGKYLTE